jgi:protein TonB
LPVQAILDQIIYPPLAAKQGLEATVILDLYIDQTGKIRKITVLKDPGYGFAEAAVAALQGRTVVPARSQGQPCAVRFRYPVRFTLK